MIVHSSSSSYLVITCKLKCCFSIQQKYSAFSYLAVPPAFAQTDANHVFIVWKFSVRSALDGSVPFESLQSHCSTMITSFRKQGPNNCWRCHSQGILPNFGFPNLVSFQGEKLHAVSLSPFCHCLLQKLSVQLCTVASCWWAVRASTGPKGQLCSCSTGVIAHKVLNLIQTEFKP